MLYNLIKCWISKYLWWELVLMTKIILLILVIIPVFIFEFYIFTDLIKDYYSQRDKKKNNIKKFHGLQRNELYMKMK